jgi:hypothetical protein
MRLGSLLVAGVVALALAQAASADKPARDVGIQDETRLIDDQCGFPVVAHAGGMEIDTTFTTRTGSVTLLGVFPGGTLTLTNLQTGKSIRLPATGSSHIEAGPDGSMSFTADGPGPSPIIVNPITGEPGIWYLIGRLHVDLDPGGNATSISFTGKQVNLCTQLAA